MDFEKAFFEVFQSSSNKFFRWTQQLIYWIYNKVIYEEKYERITVFLNAFL